MQDESGLAPTMRSPGKGPDTDTGGTTSDVTASVRRGRKALSSKTPAQALPDTKSKRKNGGIVLRKRRLSSSPSTPVVTSPKRTNHSVSSPSGNNARQSAEVKGRSRHMRSPSNESTSQGHTKRRSLSSDKSRSLSSDKRRSMSSDKSRSLSSDKRRSLSADKRISQCVDIRESLSSAKGILPLDKNDCHSSDKRDCQSLGKKDCKSLGKKDCHSTDNKCSMSSGKKRSLSSDKRRSESTEENIKFSNIAKIIDQVIKAGCLNSAFRYGDCTASDTPVKRERGRPPKKAKMLVDSDTVSPSKLPKLEKKPAKRSISSKDSSRVTANTDSKLNEKNCKSISVSPRRLKKGAPDTPNKKDPDVKRELETEEGTKEAKVIMSTKESVARSIERVISAIARDYGTSLVTDTATKDTLKVKPFKKPKNYYVRKDLKEKMTCPKAEQSVPMLGCQNEVGGCESRENDGGSVGPTLPRKRGRPKGSKNKVKFDADGNKILSKGEKKLLLKKSQAGVNKIAKLPVAKTESVSMPIKKRDYNHLLLDSTEVQPPISAEKKKDSAKIKSVKNAKKLTGKPIKVISTKLSRNSEITVKGRLKKGLKIEKKKNQKDQKKDTENLLENDIVEDNKYDTTLSIKQKLTKSETLDGGIEDSKKSKKFKKKESKSPNREKTLAKGRVKSPDQLNKGKNCHGSKEPTFDSTLSGLELEKTTIKPPKKALKEKWTREVRQSTKCFKKGIDHIAEKNGSISVEREKRNRPLYYEDYSDRESESSDDDDDDVYCLSQSLRDVKRSKQMNCKRSKKKADKTVAIPPKRTARMASLNAIAMMACMNEDAKVPLSSLTPTKDDSMALVVKESTIARTRSDNDCETDSDQESQSERQNFSRKSEQLSVKTNKAKKRKRRGELDVQMDMKDMVVTKRMASLNASAIMAASYSLESRSRRPPQVTIRDREVTNVDIQQKISYKTTKSQSTKTRSVITVQETTKKVKKAQGSRQTEVEEHIIVKKRVKRQSGLEAIEDTDKDDGNGTDNSELDHEIIPKSADRSDMIVESTITFVTNTQTHPAPQTVTLSGVSKYCITSTDGKTTTVVQQVQRKSTTTASSVASQSLASTIPAVHEPSNQHVQSAQPDNMTSQSSRTPVPNYSPLGALEVMQPAIHHSHPPHSHFLSYAPQHHHHIQHGPQHLPPHHHHPPPPPPPPPPSHIPLHHHIPISHQTVNYPPPLSPHSPPYPPPPLTPVSSSSSSLSPTCSSSPPTLTAVPSQGVPHHAAVEEYLSPIPSSSCSETSSSNTHNNNNSSSIGSQKLPNSAESSSQGVSSSMTTPSQGPLCTEDAGVQSPVLSPIGHGGLPNGPSERHHSAFSAPMPSAHSPAALTATASHGYQPVSGPMPTGSGTSNNGAYKPQQGSPGSAASPYSSPSRLTSPPPPSNKPPSSYPPPSLDHYPPHPYQSYPYPPPSPYDKYYHPRTAAYHLYQSPYHGGQYSMGGSPEYSYPPPPSGTVHYSQESYTSYTLCVPASPPRGSPQIPPHPQTLALPPPPNSNTSPHHHHQNPAYATYQYTEFTPVFPYPPPGPPPNPNCCPPNPKNIPSGSLVGGGQGLEGECRRKNQLPGPNVCNNYQYYNMTPQSPYSSHHGHQLQMQPPPHPVSQMQPKQYQQAQPEPQREQNLVHQPNSLSQSSCYKVKPGERVSLPEGKNNAQDVNLQNFISPNAQRVSPNPTQLPAVSTEDKPTSESSVSTSSSTVSSVMSPSTVSSSQVPPPPIPQTSSATSKPAGSAITTVTTSVCSEQSPKDWNEDNLKVHQYSSPTSSACGNNDAVVPNGKSTLQITTWVVPPSASPVVPSSSSFCATGVTPSDTLLLSPTTTTTSISLPHSSTSTNSVMSTSTPLVTSLEKLPPYEPETSISSVVPSAEAHSTEISNKESKLVANTDDNINEQMPKKISLTTQRIGARHLLCQPLPLTHSKTASVLAKVKPTATSRSIVPILEAKNQTSQKPNNSEMNNFVKSPDVNSEDKTLESKIPVTQEGNPGDNKGHSVPRKRGRPPRIKDPSADTTVSKGVAKNGVAAELKPFFQAPGEVSGREGKVPRKRMSLLKSSGAKPSLAVTNSNLKKVRSSSSLQDQSLDKKDLKPYEYMKFINVKTEALGKIKAEKISPLNISIKDPSRTKLINGDVDLKGEFMPPPPLGFDGVLCQSAGSFPKLKSEDEEATGAETEKKLKRKSNDTEKQGSKSPIDKGVKTPKLTVNRLKGYRAFKQINKYAVNGKVRRKASLLSYLKEKNNESDNSNDNESPPCLGKDEEVSNRLPPFVTYSPPASVMSRGRRSSGAGKGKQIRKQKPSHGWSWEGAVHEGKVWLTNDEEQIFRNCYTSIRHKEGDTIHIRDCVLLRSGSKKTDLPYIAKVAALWEDPDTKDMMMSILWYYRPEHTEYGRREEDLADEIFASKHRDHLSVACIEDRCYVLTFNEYCRYRRLLRLFQERLYPTKSPVPSSEDGYIRKERQPPGCVVQDLLFFCRKVYDYRQKRILKNPC